MKGVNLKYFHPIVIFLIALYRYTLLACKPQGVTNSVLIGETTYICLFITPLEYGSKGKVIQIASQFKADELSSITVPGCKQLLITVHF